MMQKIEAGGFRDEVSLLAIITSWEEWYSEGSETVDRGGEDSQDCTTTDEHNAVQPDSHNTEI